MEQKHLPEVIKSSRLFLRKHDPALAETMFRYVDQDRQRLSRFMPWPPLIRTVKDELDYIKMTRKAWDAHSMYDFGLFRSADGVYMGNVGVHHIEWRYDRCEIGYWILGEFEGQGYVSEAVEALVRALFQHGFLRIEIRCSALNERSARVPRRLGFKMEERLEGPSIEGGPPEETLVFALHKSAYHGN